jgi:DNA-binding transcriptional ArsR family regulator
MLRDNAIKQLRAAGGMDDHRTRARKVEEAMSMNDVRERWEEIFARHADFCRVFSDPKRLRIMWLLGEREECAVGEIAAHLGASMQNTSQHLRVMRDKGALYQRREGQTIYYRIANDKFLDGCRQIRAGVIEEFNLDLPPGPDPGAEGGQER